MALRHFGISILDADGDVSSMEIKTVAGAETLAQLTQYAQDMAVLIEPLTDGAITEIRLVVAIPLPGGLTAIPVANCEVQKGALFTFTASGTAYKHSIRIPAFVPAKFSGKNVNSADADVIVFQTAMLAGLNIGGTVIQPSDKYENDLLAVSSAVKSHRRK